MLFRFWFAFGAIGCCVAAFLDLLAGPLFPAFGSAILGVGAVMLVLANLPSAPVRLLVPAVVFLLASYVASTFWMVALATLVACLVFLNEFKTWVRG